MKRVIVLIIAFLFIGEAKVFSNPAVSVQDSLQQVLDSQPADSTQLSTLYAMVYQDLMSPSSLTYLKQLLEKATLQKDVEYQCLAMYAYVLYYFNHQDEANTVLWMDRLSDVALKNKFYNLYFTGKRAEITIHIINRKIEYSITQAEEMYKLASQLNDSTGMSSAKLCLMTGYLMTARYKEGEEAGFEAYRLLPSNASLDARKGVLQDIVLACLSTSNKDFFKYLQEYEKILDELSQPGSDLRGYRNSYLLLESLYADYYLKAGNMDEARNHLRKMDKYFFPTSYVPCRGLYYDVYSRYYSLIKDYDKALVCSDSAVSLLSGVSDNGGLGYKIKRAGILADAGQLDKAIPLFQNLLAQKDSIYSDMSTSQMDEIYQMSSIDNLLLEKERHRKFYHYIMLALIVIALLVVVPSTIRIYSVRKRLKKEEEEIRRMGQKADEANDVKSRFLANMSYNIRISLNNVLGFTQLMMEEGAEDIDAEQWKEYSDIVQYNSEGLIQLVNNVLDLSRLEAGKTKWKIEDYDLIPLCSDVIGMVRMKCGDTIRVDFKTDIESQVFRVDVARFTQVILSTLVYAEPCEEKRDVTLTVQRDPSNELLTFCVVNSPLADAGLHTQETEIRHNINRMTVEYFGGTYVVEPDATEGPTIRFTHGLKNSDSV